jgi:DNA invertase Pin-like site-specific DNA recombinase
MAVRAAIYARPMRNDKGELIDDTSSQTKRCEEFAYEHGYRVQLLLAEDEHGTEGERPELRRLRGAIWRREIDVVIATRPESLYHDTNRLVRFAKELSMIGGRLEFVDVRVDDYMFAEEPR